MLVLVLVILPVGAVLVAWPLTASVEDAQVRLDTLMASQHARSLGALPSPNRVGDAVIATENSRFFADFGPDPISLLRTGLGRATGGRDQGAATLEMQLAKNLYTPGRSSVAAKLTQLELSVKLDRAYPKRTILLMYLDAAYYGHGYYGLADAAQGYFGTGPDHLSWARASMLAGLVQAPSAYDPYVHLDLAKSRQRHVLDRLVATHVLTAAQADSAYLAPINLA